MQTSTRTTDIRPTPNGAPPTDSAPQADAEALLRDAHAAARERERRAAEQTEALRRQYRFD